MESNIEFNIEFNKKMLVETANRVLDEFEYKGKTLREWADLIGNPKTNTDCIKTMTDEELAEIMVSDCPPNYPQGDCREYEKWDGNLDCQQCWLDWLRQEVEEDE